MNQKFNCVMVELNIHITKWINSLDDENFWDGYDCPHTFYCYNVHFGDLFINSNGGEVCINGVYENLLGGDPENDR